jgi:ferritin-like protein
MRFGVTIPRRQWSSWAERALKRSREPNRLAQRILQLGGQPISKLTALIDHASDKPFKLPKSIADVHGVLKAVLDAERTSLRTYERIYRRTHPKDPVTASLALEFLSSAVHGEEDLERLIGDHAKGMSGS